MRIVDNFSTGKRENVPAGVEVIEGDLADDGVAARAAAGCDYVLHEAAIPSVPRSVKDPLGTHRANVDGTMQMLVAARDAGVKRVVFAGSSSTYGNSAVLPKRISFRSLGREAPTTTVSTPIFFTSCSRFAKTCGR